MTKGIIVQRVYIYVKEEIKIHFLCLKFDNGIGHVERKESLLARVQFGFAFARTKDVLARRNKAYSKPGKRDLTLTHGWSVLESAPCS